MNEQVLQLHDLPHNQLRKAFALRECVLCLEELQRRYAPAFAEDPVICGVLQQLRTEHETVMAALRCSPDALALLEAYEKEDNSP